MDGTLSRTVLMRQPAAYRAHIDGKWRLANLYEFPPALSQGYALVYCFNSDTSARNFARIGEALTYYPWKGDCSVAHIYTVLENHLPVTHRPRIKSIQYASPGGMELLLDLDTIGRIACAVATSGVSSLSVIKTYAAIQKQLHNVRQHNEEFKLEQLTIYKKRLKASSDLCKQLSDQIGFEGFHELEKRIDSEEIVAKLISAQFRRLNSMADYTVSGKALLPRIPDKK
jgi:hypothetical protein